MPKNNETTTKFKVDISDLKKNIQEANRQIRLANAEFKAASSGMDNWSKSTDGISTKLGQLKTVLGAQNKILDSYKQQLAMIVEEEGENSKGADELRIKIANQQAVINKTTSDINKYEKSLKDLVAEQEQSANAASDQESAYDGLKKEIRSQQSDLEELKKKYASVVIEQGKDSDSAKELEAQIGSLSGELKENKKKMDDARKAADNLDGSIDELDESTEDASEGFTVMKGALANLVSQGITAALNGLKQLGQAIVDVGKQSIGNYANYEQLVGGVETLFKESATKVQEYANQAYKTAGLSANDYMETVTSFSASLLQGLGGDTEKAADIADLAIRDMSDNANKMGTDMQSIQNAYQGFAKQNYTMLDNLKLGYGGTQAEMARLINDSGVLGNEIEVTAKTVNQVSYDKIIEAIHKVQDEMGVTGTTAQEAADTIEGSKNSMKASWQNLLTGLADDNSDVGELWNTFIDSAETYAKNALPRVKTLINNVLDYARKEMEKKAPGLVKVFDKFKGFVDWLLKNKDKVIAALTGIATAMATFMIAQKIMALVKAFQAWQIATEGVTLAQKLLNAVMAMNPIGLIVSAIAGLVAAFVVMWNTSDEFREFWINLWEQIKTVAEPIFTALVEWFKSLWETVKPIVNNIGIAFKTAWETIKTVWDAVQPYFQALWNGIKLIFSVAKKVLSTYFQTAWIAIKAIWNVAVAYFKAIWNGIKAVFSVVKTFLGGAFKTAWESIKFVWDAVIGYFRAIWNSIKLIFSVVKDVLTGNWSGAWEGIKAIVGTWKDYFASVWSGIKKVFSTVGSWFKNIFSTAWKAIKNVFKGWKDFFSGLWETIKDTFGDLGDAIGDTIGSAVIGAINGALSMVESAVNKAIDMINSVLDVINEIPGVDIGNVDEISLPRLANGGVLRRGQVGLLEGSGAEAVVPLENNKRWIAATARDLKQSLADEGMIGGIAGSGKGVVNNYNFVQNNTSPKALSRLEIYRQTRNQLNFAKGV